MEANKAALLFTTKPKTLSKYFFSKQVVVGMCLTFECICMSSNDVRVNSL